MRKTAQQTRPPPQLKLAARLPMRQARRKNGVVGVAEAAAAIAKVQQQLLRGCQTRLLPNRAHRRNHGRNLRESTPAQILVSRLNATRAWKDPLNSMRMRLPRNILSLRRIAPRVRCLQSDDRALSTLRRCFRQSALPTDAPEIRLSRLGWHASNQCYGV